MEQLASKKIGVEAFSGDADALYEYTVPHAQTGDPLGVMFLSSVDQAVIDRFRDIRNGSADGRRKGDASKAREFLFQKAFVRFELVDKDAELDLGDSPSPVQFFLKKAAKVVDAVMIQYFGDVFPDVDGKK